MANKGEEAMDGTATIGADDIKQKISSVKLSYESVMTQVINAKMERIRMLEDHISNAEQRYV